MNRQERRKKERAIENDLKVLKRLPEKDLLKISEIVSKLSKQKADEALNLIDRSFSAILVEAGMPFKDISKLQDKLAEYIDEDNRKIKLLEMENIDMSKLEKDVREFMSNLIEKGKGRKEVIEETIFKFPKLSKTSVNNAYGRIIDELGTEDVAAYILEDNKELKELLEKEEVKENKNIKPKVKAEEIKTKLKIKKIELEGEFGVYIREGDRVIAGQVTFNNYDELQEYKRKEIELFNLKMKEIEDVYKNIEVI